MTEAAAELARLEASVAEHRQLLAANPDNLYPMFADSLLSMAPLLAELGRLDEALAAAEEGVEHLRHLDAVDPAVFGVHLASGLNNLSNRLSELDRDEEGRRAGDEAVILARAAVTASQPDQARFVLISALMNQSGRSWRAGQSARAIDEMAAAVDAFREGGEALGQFLGVMVDALHKNALALAEAQLWDEAVQIRRLTAKIFPADVPSPVIHLLALTLEQAAFAKSRGGQPGEALPLAEEAAQIARDLVEVEPERYTLFLAQSLANLGSRQHEAGASEIGLQAVLEAINLFQEAAQHNPADAVLPLTMTLEAFAAILKSLGHEDQAQSVLAQRDELMEIVRQVENLDGHDHDHGHGDGCGCH
ncbi:MAG: hypothetical protein ACM33T_09280 [Solirubrobacterales bacterium]